MQNQIENLWVILVNRNESALFLSSFTIIITSTCLYTNTCEKFYILDSIETIETNPYVRFWKNTTCEHINKCDSILQNRSDHNLNWKNITLPSHYDSASLTIHWFMTLIKFSFSKAAATRSLSASCLLISFSDRWVPVVTSTDTLNLDGNDRSNWTRIDNPISSAILQCGIVGVKLTLISLLSLSTWT